MLSRIIFPCFFASCFSSETEESELCPTVLLGLTLSSESGRDAKMEYSRRQREELMERVCVEENERENLVLSYTHHKHGVSKYNRGF